MADIFELVVNLVGALIGAQFLIRYLGVKNRINQYIAYTIMVLTQLIVVTVYNNIAFISNYREWMVMLLWFVCSVILLKGRIMEKLFLVGMHNIIVCTIEIVIFSMFGKLAEYDEGRMVFGIVRMELVIAAKLMELVLIEIILEFRVKETQLVSNRVYTGLVCVIVTTLISQNYLRNIIYGQAYNGVLENEARLVACSVVIIDIIVYIICMSLTKSNSELIKERMKSLAYESKMNDIEYVRELNVQTKKMRHEMKNELLKIRIKLSENDVAAAEKYIDEMLDIKPVGKDIVYTNNILADTIINRSIERCNQAGIGINVDVGCSIKEIDEMDFAILISNLMDNAIEAAVKTKGKYVSMVMKGVDDNLYINVRNSCNENEVKNYKGRTTKKDKVYNGYGLLNVKDIVKKYKGQYMVECADGEYNTDVVLYVPKMTT